MTQQQKLIDLLQAEFHTDLIALTEMHQEINLECEVGQLRSVLVSLRDKPIFAFNQLMDVCAVDYLHYGHYDWETDEASTDGFSRAVDVRAFRGNSWEKPRFAVVYHLLSTIHNQRLRVKVFVDEENLAVPSVHDIWKSALWYEREAYDLYGILFTDHPDLRRILTDYGFIGHPFRKDFPLIGHVEMRYDAQTAKVIYEPVGITQRVTVPKVIHDDNRYLQPQPVK